MAYLFRTLRENALLGPGDKIAMATPVFTPYLQIPVLVGLRLRRRRAAPASRRRRPLRRADLRRAARPGDQGLLHHQPRQPRQPGAPAGPAGPAARARHQRPSGPDHRRRHRVRHVRRGVPRDDDRAAPQRRSSLHSFSKNFGATGTRVGFIAVHHDNVARRAAGGPGRARPGPRSSVRYGSMTSDVTKLRFIDRLVADSREVALHNIAGLATPGPGADGAVRALVPAAERPGLHRRRRGRSWRTASTALMGPLGHRRRRRAGQLLLRPRRPARGRRAKRGDELRPPLWRPTSVPRTSPCGWPASTASSCCPG